MLQLNLVGIIFRISETALQKLKAYRLGLYRYFAPKSDGEEILADLEHHIAEIFWETTESNTVTGEVNLKYKLIDLSKHQNQFARNINKVAEATQNDFQVELFPD